MDFSPFHRFNDCRRLQRIIRELDEAGAIPNELLEGYRNYHFSLIHKFRSAKYHTESLKRYLSRQDTLDEDPREVVYRVNFHFDGFCHALGSALDIFAREVLTYFDLVPSGNVYFRTARQELSHNRPGDPLLARLGDPSWLDEFKDYRNVATHESVVGIRYEQINEVVGSTLKSRLKFPLPNDPRVPPSDRTYGNNDDVVIYCQKTLKRGLRKVHPAYSDLADRIDRLGHLPL